MMAAPFGHIDSILCNKFYELSPTAQKEGVLLLQEMGLNKRQILQRTRLFKEEYNRLFDGSTPPLKISGGDE